MSDTTPRLGLPFPELGDEADAQDAVEPLALALDANAAAYGQGLLSGRPAAGMSGRFYRASDTKLLYYDNGVAWESVPAPNTVTALMLADALMAVPRIGLRWHNYNPAGWAPSGSFTDIPAALAMPAIPAIVGYSREYRARMIVYHANAVSASIVVRPPQAPTVSVTYSDPGSVGYKTATGSWVASAAMDALDGSFITLEGSGGSVQFQLREFVVEHRYIRA